MTRAPQRRLTFAVPGSPPPQGVLATVPHGTMLGSLAAAGRSVNVPRCCAAADASAAASSSSCSCCSSLPPGGTWPLLCFLPAAVVGSDALPSPASSSFASTSIASAPAASPPSSPSSFLMPAPAVTAAAAAAAAAALERCCCCLLPEGAADASPRSDSAASRPDRRYSSTSCSMLTPAMAGWRSGMGKPGWSM